MAKFKPLRSGVDSNYVLGGGLEPHFRVLFSAIFQGVSLGNFHQGRNLRKVAEAKVWSILVNPRTFFMCVLIIFYLPSEQSAPELEDSERKEEELRKRTEKLRVKVVNELRRAGDSSYNDYRFAEALESYQKALKKVERETDPILWAATIDDVGKPCDELGISFALGLATYSDVRASQRPFGKRL